MEYLFYIANGISYGMVLFIMASGLTIILGVMKTLNLAHGSFYLLGFYIAYSTMEWVNNFFIAMIISVVAVGILGMLAQFFLISRVPSDPSPQTLLTLGILYILADIMLTIWGSHAKLLPKPEFLKESIPFGALTFPIYRLAFVIIGCVIFILLWIFSEKTKWGAILRAGGENAKMAEAVGINIPRVWVLVFGLGMSLSALAGVLAGPIWGGNPGMDWEVLVFALIIIVLAGMGSLTGAFIMSIVVGIILNIGNALFPEFAMFILFFLVVIVLSVSPRGIFKGAKY